MLLLLELLVLGLVIVLAFTGPSLGARWFRQAREGLDWLAMRPRLAVLVIGLLALGTTIGMWLHCRPVPAVHDEFSYLVAADTFARGRLTNPPHPMWKHFESFHILQQPTYQSKYPPGQGLALAVGGAIGFGPAVGLWLSMALACASVCWMLQAWLPPRWAVLGGLLAAFHISIIPWWGGTYWGGGVAMLGGALVFGAVRRLLDRPRWSSSAWLAVGLVVLANTRPYEGLVASLPVAAVLLAWLLGKNRPPVSVLVVHVVLPLLSILTLAAAGMALYHYRVTGDPLRMPYQVYNDTYAGNQAFMWTSQSPFRTSTHSIMRVDNPEAVPRPVSGMEALRRIVKDIPRKVSIQWWFYLQLVLTVPLVALPYVLRAPWMRFAFLTCGLILVAVLPTYAATPHYTAPTTGLVLALVLQGMRHLRLWSYQGQPTGRFLVRAIPVVWVVSLLLMTEHRRQVQPSSDPPHFSRNRERVLAQLEQSEGLHLVIVRYGPRHNIFREWVYNAADIDRAKVVWARELGPERDRALIEYFHTRRIWLLEADAQPPRLQEYPFSTPVSDSAAVIGSARPVAPQ